MLIIDTFVFQTMMLLLYLFRFKTFLEDISRYFGTTGLDFFGLVVMSGLGNTSWGREGGRCSELVGSNLMGEGLNAHRV